MDVSVQRAAKEKSQNGRNKQQALEGRSTGACRLELWEQDKEHDREVCQGAGKTTGNQLKEENCLAKRRKQLAARPQASARMVRFESDVPDR